MAFKRDNLQKSEKALWASTDELSVGQWIMEENEDEQFWIPQKASNLQLSLCIIAYTSAARHRVIAATTKAQAKPFFWETFEDDVILFVKGFIHCLSTTGVDRVPRPFGPSLQGTEPNDLIQSDHL